MTRVSAALLTKAEIKAGVRCLHELTPARQAEVKAALKAEAKSA